MSRRERTTSIRCADANCRELAWYSYSSQREYAEIVRNQREHPYKCTRHRRPEQNLRPDNLTTSLTIVASKVASVFRGSEEFAPGLYWVADGEMQSGFTFGPGFTAHANDFPEGTRLVVTTAIEMPAEVTN